MAFSQQLSERVVYLLMERLRRVWQVLNIEREASALGTQDGAVSEKMRDRSGVESGRHDKEAECGPGALQPLEQSQGKVGVEMALVKLIEHDHIDTSEVGISGQAASQNALGDKVEPGMGARYIFEANLITDGVADLFAEFPRHATRGQTGGDAARLKHQDLSGDRRQQGRRDTGRFARAGRRFEDQSRIPLERGKDLRDKGVHGKGVCSAH
jgi:hypothetical protein